jgi:hypothetical protein
MNPKDTLFWSIEERKDRSSKELVKQCLSLYYLRVCPDNTASQSENIVIAFLLIHPPSKQASSSSRMEEKKKTHNKYRRDRFSLIFQKVVSGAQTKRTHMRKMRESFFFLLLCVAAARFFILFDES